jgi:microcin C transport system substrate-binding protein
VLRAIVLAVVLLLAPLASRAGEVTRTYGFSMAGKLELPADFDHFPYANPNAPKGGEVALSAVGSFDSFSPFIVRGSPADVTRIYDSLLRASADEASTSYGHLAATIELPADRTWVAFELRPQARFNDGTPVTAEDVAWTFKTLREQGRPFYRQYYADISDVVVEGPRRVVFHFRTDRNRELPLILGEMPILPKHFWANRDFSKPLTDPPLGSGPYRVGKFEFGRSVSYQRVPDWWARDLPTGKGLDNFDTIRIEYFRDATVALEAFKAGQIDFRQENIAKQWATAYDFPAVRKGLVKLEEIRHHLPTGMQGFAFNARRPLFKDVRVRKALAWAFDFEWANRNLFYNAYTRTKSYFSNSDLASSGLPQGAELALLNQYRDKLPASIFTEPFTLPVTDGSGNNREELRQSLALLKQAGYVVRDRQLVGPDGKQVSFEILLDEPAFERVALPYVQTLAKLGIDARVRTVDPAQYQRLTDSFDFDMAVAVFGESVSPGNEQLGYWTCDSAKQEGSDNIMGVCDPVVDALVGKLISANDYAEQVVAAQALDRVLLAGWYVVPHWHTQSLRVAYWDRFARQPGEIRTGIDFDAWWIDPVRSAAIEAAKRGGN